MNLQRDRAECEDPYNCCFCIPIKCGLIILTVYSFLSLWRNFEQGTSYHNFAEGIVDGSIGRYKNYDHEQLQEWVDYYSNFGTALYINTFFCIPRCALWIMWLRKDTQKNRIYTIYATKYDLIM